MISTWLILGRQYISHPASVSIQGQGYTSPVGIFGYFEQGTISYPSPLPRQLKVIAQDLASDTPVDITSRVKIKGNHLIIPGKVINQIGLMNATPGDLSAPGMVIQMQRLIFLCLTKGAARGRRPVFKFQSTSATPRRTFLEI